MQLFFLSMCTQIAVASFAPYLQIVFRNKGYSHSLCGVLIALCQLSAIVVPMVISSLSDKKGRTKPFLILSALLAILFSFPYILSGNIALVALSAFLMNGFFWCMNPLADGFINRSLKGDSSRYGTIRAMGTFAYVSTLVIFGILGWPREDENSSILKCMMVSLPLLFLVCASLKEEVREKGKESTFSLSVFPRRFYFFLIVVAFTRLGQAVVEKLLSAYMTENLGLGNRFILFIALGAAFEVFCMVLFGRLKKKGVMTSLTILRISAVALVIRLLLYLIPGLLPFILAQTLHGLTFGALHLSATSYIADNVDSSHYDLGMTMYWSLATNLPELIGALFGGFIIESFGYSMLFLSYSVFLLIGFVLSYVWKGILEGKER